MAASSYAVRDASPCLSSFARIKDSASFKSCSEVKGAEGGLDTLVS